MAKRGNYKRWKQIRGFTLIELLVVIAIIGILASIILASLSSAKTKGLSVQRISNMHSIQNALEIYNTTYGHYPISATWQSQCAGWGGVAGSNVIPGLIPTYMGSMPADPGMIAASNVDCFVYISTPSGSDYKLVDYNLDSTVTPGSYPVFVDPARNIGKAWQVSGCPSASEGTPTWAIWSSTVTQCY